MPLAQRQQQQAGERALGKVEFWCLGVILFFIDAVVLAASDAKFAVLNLAFFFLPRFLHA